MTGSRHVELKIECPAKLRNFANSFKMRHAELKECTALCLSGVALELLAKEHTVLHVSGNRAQIERFKRFLDQQVANFQLKMVTTSGCPNS